jgi:hypothetical protein
VTTWLICIAIAAVLGFVVWGFARASSREMPPYPEDCGNDCGGPEGHREGCPVHCGCYDERPWQPDPSRFGRCPSCGTHRPLEDGLIAAHDRPEPQVPFNVQTFPCRGAGQAPMQPMETER